MSRINRIQKRDKPVVQVRKLIKQGMREVVAPPGTASGTFNGVPGGTPLGNPDEGSRVMVEALGTSTPGVPEDVNRAALEPQGAMYAVDDPTPDRVKLRHSPLMDPLTILYM